MQYREQLRFGDVWIWSIFQENGSQSTFKKKKKRQEEKSRIYNELSFSANALFLFLYRNKNKRQ